MGECSVVRGLVVERGSRADYEGLSGYHYRDEKIGPYSNIFVLRRVEEDRSKKTGDRRREKCERCESLKGAKGAGEVVGVIVYSMPAGGVELRREALGGYFDGLGNRAAVMKFINERVRVISRVIIEPRYRGLGLAARLVRETMGQVGVEIVEALAVMGQVNPFFEKAGMRAFYGPERTEAKVMREALSWAGIEESEWIDPGCVCEKINRLDAGVKLWLVGEMGKFLGAYGRKGREKTVAGCELRVAGLKEVPKCGCAEVRKCEGKVVSDKKQETSGVEEGVRMVSMVLKKLGARAVYYVWKMGGEERK